MRGSIYHFVLEAALITATVILLFNITGCKPQQTIIERESNSILELQDSLTIKEAEIALINTITNRFINEGFQLNNETVVHEIMYDSENRVSSERFINSNTKLIKAIEGYEVAVSEKSIESDYLQQRSSVLQFETDEVVLEERKQNSSLNYKLCFVVIIVVVLLIVAVLIARLLKS